MMFKQYTSGLLIFLLVGSPLDAAYSPLPTSEIANTNDSSAIDTATHTMQANTSTSIGFGSVSLSKAPVTMDFQDTDIRDILHVLALKSGINMVYAPDVSGPLTLHLDQVPFDQAFQTVLTLKGLVALSIGPRILRIITSNGLAAEQSQAATFTKVFRLNYANAAEIKQPIDAIRLAAGRKGVSTIDTTTNSIVITDTEEGLRQVQDLIPSLDRRPEQVDIEAKIVEVTLDNQTQMGISWAFAKSAGQNFIGSSQVPGSTILTAGQGSLPGGYVDPPGSFSAAGTVQGTGFSSPLPSINNISSAFSFIHSEAAYALAAQISALAAKDRVKVLSTPHIVTLNNQQADINVTSQIPYLVTTIANGGAGTQTNSYQFVNPGVKLTVKPTINADKRITLHITPAVSNATSQTGGAAPPTIQERDADTTLLLRDGETVAIGGLITEDDEKVVTGIPLLMDIPFLGALFRTKTDRKTRDELIVFVTPRIASE